MKPFLIILALSICCSGQSPWRKQTSGTDASLRSISAISDKVAWVSGSGGTVLHTVNAGKRWRKCALPSGGESLDFRGVHAWSKDEAVIMSSGPAENNQAKLFKTTDGCKTWHEVFSTTRKGIFFDAIVFYPGEPNRGVVLSDPVDGHFRLFESRDRGDHWAELLPKQMPRALGGEGAFAASNTALSLIGNSNMHDLWFGTGGGQNSRIFQSHDGGENWTAVETPIPAGKPSAGIFSVYFFNSSEGLAVGGDYAAPNWLGIDGIKSTDSGLTWQTDYHGPYLSCTTPYSLGVQQIGPVPLEPGEPKDLNACSSSGLVVGQHGAIYRAPGSTTIQKH